MVERCSKNGISFNSIGGYEPTLACFFAPMASLFVILFGTIFWTGDVFTNGLMGAFKKSNITTVIMVAFYTIALVACTVGCVKGLWQPVKVFDTFVNGMIEFINVLFTVSIR